MNNSIKILLLKENSPKEMFRDLVKRAQNLPRGDVLTLNRKEMIYYSPLKRFFPDIEYFFREPDLIVVGDLPASRPSNKIRFVQVISKEDLERLNELSPEVPILADRDLYEVIEKRFPGRKFFSEEFSLNDDLIRLALLYLPRVDFLRLIDQLGRFVTTSFWRERVRLDFPNLSEEADYFDIKRVENLKKKYLDLFSRDMTLPEAIEYGKTCPDLRLFPRKMAVAFGMMLTGCEKKAKKALGDIDFKFRLSVHLHKDSDEELARFLRQAFSPSRKSNDLSYLFRKVNVSYIWYFTPEIIKRAVKLGIKPQTILEYGLENETEYLSPDVFFYLIDLYPREIDPEFLVDKFRFWLEERADIKKRFLGPILEKLGWYIVRVVYELKGEIITTELAEQVREYLPEGGGIDEIKEGRSYIIDIDNRYYLIVEGYVEGKDHKFVGGSEVAIDRETDEERQIDLVPVEVQVYTIHDKPRHPEIVERALP